MRARSGLGLHNNLLLVLKIHFLPPPFLLSLDIICTYLPRILFLPLRICDVTLHLVEHPRPHFVMTTRTRTDTATAYLSRQTLSPGREVRPYERTLASGHKTGLKMFTWRGFMEWDARLYLLVLHIGIRRRYHIQRYFTTRTDKKL